MASSFTASVVDYRPDPHAPVEAPSLWERLKRRRWAFATAAVALAAGVALVNLVVDPYCAYRAIVPGLFDYKPAYGLPKTKAELVAALRPTSLILGGGSAAAFNPRWSGWGPYGALNLAMESATMDRNAKALRYAMAHGRVERVLLCLDLAQFDRDESFEAFDESRFSPDFSPAAYHFENLFSPAACRDSWRTVSAFLSDEPAEYTLHGDLRVTPAPRFGASRERFVRSIRELEKQYRTYRRSSEAMTGLREIVSLCDAREVELTVAVTPVHALYLETLASRELWDEYEAWLQEVVEIVDEESDGRVAVWDFAGYNRYTTEETPTHDRAPAPEFYREPARFTATLADEVMARVYRSPDADHAFGVRLTRGDLGRRIAELRTERAAWLAQRPGAIALLGSVFPERLADAPREARR